MHFFCYTIMKFMFILQTWIRDNNIEECEMEMFFSVDFELPPKSEQISVFAHTNEPQKVLFPARKLKYKEDLLFTSLV